MSRGSKLNEALKVLGPGWWRGGEECTNSGIAGKLSVRCNVFFFSVYLSWIAGMVRRQPGNNKKTAINHTGRVIQRQDYTPPTQADAKRCLACNSLS